MAINASARKHRQERTDDVKRQELNEFVATTPSLDGVDVRVYLYLSALLNFTEFIHVPQIQMADTLQRQKTHISRSIRKLVEVEVLIPGPNGTRASEWMLNPDFNG
jgi:predicted transcriptional regulator